jgi:hypothetical protein
VPAYFKFSVFLSHVIISGFPCCLSGAPVAAQARAGIRADLRRNFTARGGPAIAGMVWNYLTTSNSATRN